MQIFHQWLELGVLPSMINKEKFKNYDYISYDLHR